jgi:hypothetical protein
MSAFDEILESWYVSSSVPLWSFFKLRLGKQSDLGMVTEKLIGKEPVFKVWKGPIGAEFRSWNDLAALSILWFYDLVRSEHEGSQDNKLDKAERFQCCEDLPSLWYHELPESAESSIPASSLRLLRQNRDQSWLAPGTQVSRQVPACFIGNNQYRDS